MAPAAALAGVEATPVVADVDRYPPIVDNRRNRDAARPGMLEHLLRCLVGEPGYVLHLAGLACPRKMKPFTRVAMWQSSARRNKRMEAARMAVGGGRRRR